MKGAPLPRLTLIDRSIREGKKLAQYQDTVPAESNVQSPIDNVLADLI
jgi:hypothetical protein